MSVCILFVYLLTDFPFTGCHLAFCSPDVWHLSKSNNSINKRQCCVFDTRFTSRDEPTKPQMRAGPPLLGVWRVNLDIWPSIIQQVCLPPCKHLIHLLSFSMMLQTRAVWHRSPSRRPSIFKGPRRRPVGGPFWHASPLLYPHNFTRRVCLIFPQITGRWYIMDNELMGISSAGPQAPRAAAVKETGAVKSNRSTCEDDSQVQQVTPK